MRHDTGALAVVGAYEEQIRSSYQFDTVQYVSHKTQLQQYTTLFSVPEVADSSVACVRLRCSLADSDLNQKFL